MNLLIRFWVNIDKQATRADTMTKKKNPQIDQDDPQAKIIIDWDLFEKLCELHCTEEEIAGIFDCSIDTLNNRVKDKFKLTFSEVFKRKSAKGKRSLRRAQFVLASGVKDDEGNYKKMPDSKMLIHLGKQYLDQKDKVQHSNDPKEPFNLLGLVQAAKKYENEEEFNQDQENKKDKEK